MMGTKGAFSGTGGCLLATHEHFVRMYFVISSPI